MFKFTLVVSLLLMLVLDSIDSGYVHSKIRRMKAQNRMKRKYYYHNCITYNSSCRKGPPICEQWCQKPEYIGGCLRFQTYCCKYRERPGQCPADSRCVRPLPFHLTSIYRCQNDYECQGTAKCCLDSCYTHPVCKDTVPLTVTPATSAPIFTHPPVIIGTDSSTHTSTAKEPEQVTMPTEVETSTFSEEDEKASEEEETTTENTTKPPSDKKQTTKTITTVAPETTTEATEQDTTETPATTTETTAATTETITEATEEPVPTTTEITSNDSFECPEANKLKCGEWPPGWPTLKDDSVTPKTEISSEDDGSVEVEESQSEGSGGTDDEDEPSYLDNYDDDDDETEDDKNEYVPPRAEKRKKRHLK